MTEALKLQAALAKIVTWDSHPLGYAVDYGSNGVRDFYRAIAQKALTEYAAEPPAQVVSEAVHVGDSMFEHWFSEYDMAHKGTKQQMRDAYAAGMGDTGHADHQHRQPVSEPVAYVFLVATGEVYEGQETYTRHEGSPPPLCDSEALYTRPASLAPMTPDEMWLLWNEQGIDEMNQSEAIAFARAVEAHHARGRG